MKIAIIGSGNAANVLGRKIRGSGHTIVQVTGRNSLAVNALSRELDCPPNIDPAAVYTADIYLVAIADKALAQLQDWLQLDKGIVVHTAASVSKDVLRNVSRNYGVLYPLQTLRKEQTEMPEIPFLVDGNTADDLAIIQDFAETLSDKVWVAGDELRLKVHVAAVFASNFTNHMYVLAEEFCRKEQLDFSLLLPLINETANRLYSLSPRESQTGPAIRNDLITIEKHLEVLKAHPNLKEIYEHLTRSIQQT